MCKKHQNIERKAGYCQAVEECGQPCNRIAIHCPPYHLCSKHEAGVDTLPCHFMRLPTELRLVIFRYLFPPVVSISPAGKIHLSILKVNRQLNIEAKSILYKELRFRASMNYDRLRILGRDWTYEPDFTDPHEHFSPDAILRHSHIKLIQNLDLDIVFSMNQKAPRYIDRSQPRREEHRLFVPRDLGRGLVDLLATQQPNSPNLLSNQRSGLKKLNVTFKFASYFHWSTLEATAAIFTILEPLRALTGVDATLEITSLTRCEFSTVLADAYINKVIRKLKKDAKFNELHTEWIAALRAPISSYRQDMNPQVETAYRRILDFCKFLYAQQPEGIGYTWMHGAFQGIERPLHLARLAHSLEDLPALNKIRDVLTTRWINAQREQQRILQLAADKVNNMFVGDENDSDTSTSKLTAPTSNTALSRAAPPRQLYPDAFQFPAQDPLPTEHSVDPKWPELEWKDATPRIGMSGVLYRVKGLRVYIEKGNKQYVRLLTPELVRQIEK